MEKPVISFAGLGGTFTVTRYALVEPSAAVTVYSTSGSLKSYSNPEGGSHDARVGDCRHKVRCICPIRDCNRYGVVTNSAPLNDVALYGQDLEICYVLLVTGGLCYRHSVSLGRSVGCRYCVFDIWTAEIIRDIRKRANACPVWLIIGVRCSRSIRTVRSALSCHKHHL